MSRSLRVQSGPVMSGGHPLLQGKVYPVCVGRLSDYRCDPPLLRSSLRMILLPTAYIRFKLAIFTRGMDTDLRVLDQDPNLSIHAWIAYYLALVHGVAIATWQVGKRMRGMGPHFIEGMWRRFTTHPRS